MRIGESVTQTLNIPSRYLSSRLIAEGGSGRVYRVMDSTRDLSLALKVVGPAEAAWLRREFDTLRQIRHENLIQVYDWGSLGNGGAYYTMELLEGGDWGQKRELPQEPEEVRRVLTSLLRGLAHLHSHGEIHGDLKPGNILLGAGAVVKVSDVGMGAITGTATTPGFAAPEIWEGGRATIQGDIYSAGVMAYEALTGHHPFEGRTVREVVSGQLEGWVASPRAHGVVIPADLERSIMRALERNPALRQPSADDFLEEIGAQDRVGLILGGRFAGRNRELSRLHGYLSAGPSENPTAVFVSGPPGVGKTALIDEFAHQCLSLGRRVLDVAGGDLTRGLAVLLESQDDQLVSGDAEIPLSVIAEGLWCLGATAPVFVRFHSRPSEENQATDYLLKLGRFLSALAFEREEASRILLALELHEASRSIDSAADLIVLETLDCDETGLLATGFLGNLCLEASQRQRLHAATGGMPSAVLDLITDLISRGVLVRRAGEWSLRDIEELRELRYSGTPARLEIAWHQLDAQQQRLLLAIALFEQGIGVSSLGRIEEDVSVALQVLASKGWTAVKRTRVTAASQGVRSAVLNLASPAERAGLERLILADTDTDIDRADRAVGLLLHPDLPGALELGLQSAESSFTARDYTRAAESGQRCLRIALESGDREVAKRALVLVAEGLHRLGKYDDANRLLADECPIAAPDDDSSFMAQRERLLGTIHLEQGDLAKAREHLSRSIDLADVAGEMSLSLRSQADLADIDWRYGDESQRAKAMARVKEVIARVPDTGELRNERAALMYQLGSALIMSGRREEAASVLQAALGHEPGDYWRMRIANAAGAAEYYLGHFEAALKWSDEARRYADASGSDSYKARIHSNRAGLYYGLGRFRDAVEHHGLSAMWARRTGSMLEYQAACAGASINLTMTGRYEEAVVQARESARAAGQTGDTPELAKSHELEALAHFHIGDYQEAERLVALGLRLAKEADAEVAPRLDWLAARLAGIKGDWASAEDHLKQALSVLQVSKDWEDLPGVQIELEFVAFRKKDRGFDLSSIVRPTLEAERGGAVIVFLRGALAVGQILLEGNRDDVEGRDLLSRALTRAEASDAAELAWQLSYLIGEIDLRRGDLKSASSRKGRGLRGLREIADRLSPDHRILYLQTPHARDLLLRMAS